MKSVFKFLIKTISCLLLLFATVVALLYVTDNQYMIKAFKQTYLKGLDTPPIDDWLAFNNNIILKSTKPQEWSLDSDYNKISPTAALKKKLEKDQSISFLIAKDGKLLFENYWNGHNEKGISNSFSMAKSVVTLLLGFAIQDGHVKGLDQSILDFLPEYKGLPWADRVTVADLARMSSGLDWEEYYHSPNSTAKAYYGTNVAQLVFSKSFIEQPGKAFKYLSANTQLLTILLRRATKKSLTDYAEEKLWNPLGMSQAALWGLDDEGGVEKGFCCIYATTRDYARLGQFLLQKGKWGEDQLLNEEFVYKVTHPALAPEYGYGTWTDYDFEPQFFSYQGHQGQYIIVVPEHNLVIVRLGEKDDEKLRPKKMLREEVYFYIEETLKMIKGH